MREKPGFLARPFRDLSNGQNATHPSHRGQSQIWTNGPVIRLAIIRPGTARPYMVSKDELPTNRARIAPNLSGRQADLGRPRDHNSENGPS